MGSLNKNTMFEQLSQELPYIFAWQQFPSFFRGSINTKRYTT